MDLHPVPKERHPSQQSSTLDALPEAFSENENHYRELVEHSDDLLCLHDLQGRLLYINPAPARVLGYSEEELLKIPMRELVAPEYRAQFSDYLGHIARDGEAEGLLAVLTRSGERRIWQYRNRLRNHGGGSPIVRGMARDITELKRAEYALRAREADLNRAQALAHIGSWRFDFRKNAIHLSDESCRILGLPLTSSLDPSRVREIVHPDDQERLCNVWTAALTLGSGDVEHRILTHGLVRWIRLLASIDFDSAGTPLSAMGTVQDITDRKQAETALVSTAQRYRLLFDKNLAGVALATPEGKMLECNDAWAHILGYQSADEIRGRSAAEFYFDPAEREPLLEELTRERCFLARELRLRRKDGSPVWVLFNSALQSSEDGGSLIQATILDITKRRQAEERLREYEKALEGLEEMIVVVDRDYRYVVANRAFLKYRGLERGQIEGQLVADLLRPGVFENVIKEKLDACFQGKVVTYEMRYDYPKLGKRDLLISYFPIEGASGIERAACVLQDLTERKQAEEALRASERRQFEISKRLETESARLIEAQAVAKVGSWELELPTLEVTWSEQTYRIFEADSSHFKPSRSEFVKVIHPQDRAKVDAAFHASLQSGERSAIDYRIVLPDGRVKLLEEHWKVFRDDQDRPVRLVGTCHDITERKRAEEALRRSEENYRMFVTQSSEGIFRQDLDAPIPIDLPEDEMVQRILHDSYMAECNDAIVKMYGLSSINDFLGKRLTETLDPSDPGNIELTREFIRSGFRVSERESREVDVHGNSRVFLNSLIGIVEDGKLMRTWGIQRDVTDRVVLEQERAAALNALRRSEERFRVSIKNSPVTVFNLDRDLRYTWVYNPHFRKPEEVIGKTTDELLGPENSRKLNELNRRVLETGIGQREEVMLMLGGTPRCHDMTLEPLRDSAGNIVGITGASLDIARLREMTDRLVEAKDKLANEKLYLEQEIQAELGFKEIIGKSPALKDVLKQAAIVAPIDATVLLLGETGTGKELVARSIHRLSSRRENNFIKLNCAAVPAGLLESELFGHEKGAFTGAVSHKLGRLELADKGTLFLDEIGEMPLELQPKLLRVLQDHEFEHLGGNKTLRVDVRVVAATNRDLMSEVLNKRFREDLFYRLNVFPIQLPPLRERRSDIPLLVDHFQRKHSARMNKRIESVSPDTMQALIGWSWPGNIRELENLIERLVILNKGPVLALAPAELSEMQQGASDDTLGGIEREHILRVLRETHGVLSGPAGAASRLGLKRQTLQSMLKRYKIEPRAYRRGFLPPNSAQ